MKFIVDAQLPRRLAHWLKRAGHDAMHTLDLPNGNRTTDAEISALADRDDRIVITKDADFVNGHLLHGQPSRLLVVSTGNITNSQLDALFATHHIMIVLAFRSTKYVELTQAAVILHA